MLINFMAEKLIINFDEYTKIVEKLAIQIHKEYKPTVLGNSSPERTLYFPPLTKGIQPYFLITGVAASAYFFKLSKFSIFVYSAIQYPFTISPFKII